MAIDQQQTANEGAMSMPPRFRAPGWAFAILFVASPRASMHALQRRYGDAYTVQLPSIGKAVVVSDPALVKQVLSAKNDVLHNGDPHPLTSVLGHGSMFALEEDRHTKERRLISPSFRGDRMRSYREIIVAEARREMRDWPEGKPFATLDPFMRITLAAILRAVFGAEGEHFDELKRDLPRAVELGSKLAPLPGLHKDWGPLSPWTKFLKLRDHCYEVLGEMVDEAGADPDLANRADVLASLVQSSYDDGTRMTRRDILDELMTMLAAGHETTASSLAWMIERLQRHPELLARLVEEAQGEESTLRMATILELQRVRPIIPAFFRRVMTPFALGDWVLPRGTNIVVSTTNLHRDERNYERPEEFDPDRFLARKAPESTKWTPFGGGVRRCIGEGFAMMEMDLVLREILRNFEITVSTEAAEKTYNRGIALVPRRGGRVTVRRKPAAAEALG
ncbi:MAG: cytochrome P450 [Renibacterium sp.]|nr:cytochrome P450 [Renibacterium sp.]